MNHYLPPPKTFESFETISYDGNFYGWVVPEIYRDKVKFWERNKKDHRADGPSDIFSDISYWSYNGTSVNNMVMSWCNINEADIQDLSETELLIMWSEIL